MTLSLTLFLYTVGNRVNKINYIQVYVDVKEFLFLIIQFRENQIRHRNHMYLLWVNELQGRKIESMSIIVVHEQNVHNIHFVMTDVYRNM